MELTEKRCPQCAETIKSEAIKCRFCQADLTLHEKMNSGIPARRILYVMGLAAFIVSGLDLAGAPYGSSRQAEGYLLTVISIALIVVGIVVQVSQRKAGDKRSDITFWVASVITTVVLIFIGMLTVAWIGSLYSANGRSRYGMKYFFTVTLVAGLVISLTSCSKEDENSGSSRGGYASVSDFKLPETTIATPAPWAPTPFDSKSGIVKPNDLSTFMESLVASGAKSKKGEFETTADYNKRIANIDAVFAPVKGSEIYALTGGPQYFEYNADKQEFKALSGMLCMEGYKFSKSTVSCDAGTVEAAQRNATRESGLLKNVGTDYYLLFPTSRLKKYRQDPLYKFPETCPVPIEKAKDVSKNLRIAYAFRITKAEVATGDGRYVEPTSLLQYYDAVGIFVSPEYFICYDKMSGQVLYQNRL